MLQILTPSKTVEHVEFAQSYVWQDDAGAGFDFPCDADGNLLEGDMRPEAWHNLKACLEGSYLVRFAGVVTYAWTYTDPAIALCVCGRELALPDTWANVCACGREYNGWGQCTYIPLSYDLSRDD